VTSSISRMYRVEGAHNGRVDAYFHRDTVSILTRCIGKIYNSRKLSRNKKISDQAIPCLFCTSASLNITIIGSIILFKKSPHYEKHSKMTPPPHPHTHIYAEVNVDAK
jgi:hypothetical protein